MIILMGEKQWKKHCKKLVEPKDYVVLDASDRDATEAKVYGKYSNAVQLDHLSIPEKVKKLTKKVAKLASDDDGDVAEMLTLESGKIDKKFIKGWEETLGPMDAIHTVLKAQGEGRDKQIFVVFRSKDYTLYGKFIKRVFERVLGFDPDGDRESGIIYLFEDWNKDRKFFANPMKDGQMNRIEKTCAQLTDTFCGFDPEKYNDKIREAAKKEKKKNK